ncbi:MAG TPA: tRNA (guanosine(37)-N1)-methyltransferase TrmD [Symbiobacteriaceae bacterium]|nr:tRNA (guanosine(37)-N1)-methyltransferase TrmD [Symbiobacteriaceae bacterium]
MLIHILTIHPSIIEPALTESILGRARDAGLVDARPVNIRDFAFAKHQSTDDYPYGGGAGLVMKPEPIAAAVEWCRGQTPAGAKSARVILMDPQGRPFTQAVARELAESEHLIFVCGRYEGFDERIRSLATDEISLGDYVLMGGELPALVITEAVTRLVPGVLGDLVSTVNESHSAGLLEGPQYTRPPVWNGLEVPEILLKGDHGAMERWRRREALRRTLERRPDLLAGAPLTDEDRRTLHQLKGEPIPPELQPKPKRRKSISAGPKPKEQ